MRKIILLLIFLVSLNYAYADTWANYAVYCNFSAMSDDPAPINSNVCQKGSNSPVKCGTKANISNGQLIMTAPCVGTFDYAFAFNMTGSLYSPVITCEARMKILNSPQNDANFIHRWDNGAVWSNIYTKADWALYQDALVYTGAGLTLGTVYDYKYTINDDTNAAYLAIYSGGVNLGNASDVVTPPFPLMGLKNNDQGTTYMNWFFCYNGTQDPSIIETSPPVLSSINVTSGEKCYNLDNESNEPCPLSDPTPTLAFITNEEAWCRLSNTDESYTDMSTQCSSGEGDLMHICTLSSAEQLSKGTDYVYLACNDSSNNYHTSPISSVNTITFDITSVNESDGRAAIEAGVENALASYTAYTDQQVYIRNINDNQTLGNYDKVISSGNQRWLFEYKTGSDTYTNAPDLGTTVIIWENESLFSGEIINQVGILINNTKD